MKIKEKIMTYAAQTHSDVDAFLMEDGRTLNFSGWNGVKYSEWWNDNDDNDCGRDALPIYEELTDENGEGLDQYEIVGMEL